MRIHDVKERAFRGDPQLDCGPNILTTLNQFIPAPKPSIIQATVRPQECLDLLPQRIDSNSSYWPSAPHLAVGMPEVTEAPAPKKNM
jgi:hypothetical protein